MKRRYFALPPFFLLSVVLAHPSPSPDVKPVRVRRVSKVPLPVPVLPTRISAREEPPSSPAGFSSGIEGPREEDLQRQGLRDVAWCLKRACRCYLEERFHLVAQYCDEILKVFPNYSVALELRNVAQRSRHATWADPRFFDAEVHAWLAVTSDGDEPSIPEDRTMDWRDLTLEPHRITPLRLRRVLEEIDWWEDPEVIAINRKLDTMRIDLGFKSTKLEDIYSFVRDFSGLNLILDAAMRERVDLERPMDLTVKDWRLKDVLQLLLSFDGLEYVVTEENVVMLTSPDRVAAFRPQK